MDELEKLIVENRGAFDKEREAEAGWKELRKEMNRAERSSDTFLYWKVAAVIFMISTVVLSVMNFSGSDETSQPELSQSYSDFEEFYVQQISVKKQEYGSIAGQSEREDLFRDLERMDAAYSELKSSFSEYESEEMADAMLENLRLRIMILNEQIEIIKRGKSSEEAFHSS